jgi:hypothetical protein
MEEAVRTVGPNSILLTTDADAVPARNWIDANLAAIENGVDLVGGYIMGDHREEALLGPGFLQRPRVTSTMRGSSIRSRR